MQTLEHSQTFKVKHISNHIYEYFFTLILSLNLILTSNMTFSLIFYIKLDLDCEINLESYLNL